MELKSNTTNIRNTTNISINRTFMELKFAIDTAVRGQVMYQSNLYGIEMEHQAHQNTKQNVSIEPLWN